MPASLDPPIRVAHALLGRTSQRLAPMHAGTVKLASFLRRQLQSAVRLAHHTRTRHPEALAVNVMQAMQSPGKGLGTPMSGTPMAVAAGGFSEVCERGGRRVVCYSRKAACHDEEIADTRTYTQVIRVRRAVLGSTRRSPDLLSAKSVRLASLPTVRLLSSARTVVRMRIPVLGARSASA